MRRLIILSMLLLTPLVYADQTLQLPAFNAIKTDGVFDMLVTAGSAQSVVVKGANEEIAKLHIEVVDGELVITTPRGSHEGLKLGEGSNSISITLPSLRLFRAKGVGEVIIKNIEGDRIDLSYEGVGNMEVSGKIKWLRLKGSGVGSIDTKKLLAENADVDFGGIGDVSVYASNRLNAVVHGVGSLTYYGNPKTVNKQANGIGSVSPGN